MDSTGIEGKVFVVSGAASGIGRATASRLADLGASGLSISDIDSEGLEETRQLCKSASNWLHVNGNRN